MENYSGLVNEDDQLELPPGFRFHPTDEELITHYLCKKAVDNKFVSRAIGDVDMNKVEPWELPWRAKLGEKEWYFFYVKDKKYPTGLRTNRATAAGYWKATGKDKEIFKGKSLVGMKKTLVFYRGRAPKGEKTNWVTHEYRLEGKSILRSLPKSAKNGWVICRVFHKTAGGKKVPISGIAQSSSEMVAASVLPPLMDTSAAFSGTTKPASMMPESAGHVHCFSSSFFAQKSQEDNMFNPYLNHSFMAVSNSEENFHRSSFTNASTWGRVPIQANYQFPGSYPMQDQGIMRALLDNYGQNVVKQSFKTEESQETGLSTDLNTEISSVVSNVDMRKNALEDQEAPSTCVGQQELDCLWNY